MAPQEDWKFLAEFAGRTNARLREQATSGGLLRPGDCIEGSNSYYIQGPLAHVNPEGSRFSNGDYGVLYAGLDFDTALAEVKYQRERFLRRTSEGPQRFDMRVVVMDVDGEFHDLRGAPGIELSDTDKCLNLAQELRAAGSYGIVFDSERRPGGHCIAVFRAPVLKNALQERHFAFVWDGCEIIEILEYSKASG